MKIFNWEIKKYSPPQELDAMQFLQTLALDPGSPFVARAAISLVLELLYSNNVTAAVQFSNLCTEFHINLQNKVYEDLSQPRNIQ